MLPVGIQQSRLGQTVFLYVSVLSNELCCHLNDVATSCLKSSPLQLMSQIQVVSFLSLQRFPAVVGTQASFFSRGLHYSSCHQEQSRNFSCVAFKSIHYECQLQHVWKLQHSLLSVPVLKLHLYFWIAHVALPQAAWQAEKFTNAFLSYKASILQYPKQNLLGILMLCEEVSQIPANTANISFLLTSLHAVQAYTAFYKNPKQENWFFIP